MELHLKFIGILLVLISLIHLGFSQRFNWKEDLKSISLINRQMMYVHTFFVAFTVLLIGVLSFVNAADMVNTNLGRQLCLGLGVFWAIRFYCQFFVYSSELWRGKTFETIVHIGFSVLWAYVSVVYFAAYFL